MSEFCGNRGAANDWKWGISCKKRSDDTWHDDMFSDDDNDDIFWHNSDL